VIYWFFFNFVATTPVTHFIAFMAKILDAGFCLPAIASRSGEAGGDTGFKRYLSLFYPASGIQYPVSVQYDLNVRFQLSIQRPSLAPDP
jgi:hypothetical protein